MTEHHVTILTSHIVLAQSVRQILALRQHKPHIGPTLQTHHSDMFLSVTMSLTETQDAVTGEEASAEFKGHTACPVL